MARSSSVAFQGSLWGRLLWSWQSLGPRLRHLRTVSVLTLKRFASTPVGSRERAISRRTAGVVRACGWMASIRASLGYGVVAWSRRNAKHIPESPNERDPNDVPLPNNSL